MLKPDVAEALLRVIPGAYHKDAIVAGGMAADPEKAGDIDLWILNVPEEDFNEVEDDIRGYLVYKKLLSPYASQLAYPFYEEPDTQDFRVIYEGAAPKGLDKPLQILITCQPTPLHLLRRFDITAHQIAYALIEPERPLRAATYTTPLEQPRVLRFTRPQTRQMRIKRIASRYGFEPHPDDIRRLNALMEQEAA